MVGRCILTAEQGTSHSYDLMSSFLFFLHLFLNKEDVGTIVVVLK